MALPEGEDTWGMYDDSQEILKSTGYSASGSGSSSDHETEKVEKSVSQAKRKPPTGRKSRNSRPAKFRKLSTSSDDSCKKRADDVAIVPHSHCPSSDDSSIFYMKPCVESAGPERTRLVCRSDHSDQTDSHRLQPVPASQSPAPPLAPQIGRIQQLEQELAERDEKINHLASEKSQLAAENDALKQQLQIQRRSKTWPSQAHPYPKLRSRGHRRQLSAHF